MGVSDEVQLVMVSDPGQDLDDEMAVLVLRSLVAQGAVEPLCVIANLAPSPARARLLRGTLDALGLEDVAVGVGSDGGTQTHADTFSDLAREYMPDEGRERSIGPGDDVLRAAFERAPPKSITLLCISSLKDAATFFERDRRLFLDKIRVAVIMGGVAPRARDDAPLEPDAAANNAFDFDSARFFYRELQLARVPMVVVGRAAAYACPLPRSVYDDLLATDSPIAARLHRAQRRTIHQLWIRARAPPGAPERAGLPPRCDRVWFSKTFCGGADLDDDDNDIWSFVQNFNMYDPIALVACHPHLRREFFRPKYLEIYGTTHTLIGVEDDSHGINDVPRLRDFLTYHVRRGLRYSSCHDDGAPLTSPDRPRLWHTPIDVSPR